MVLNLDAYGSPLKKQNSEGGLSSQQEGNPRAPQLRARLQISPAPHQQGLKIWDLPEQRGGDAGCKTEGAGHLQLSWSWSPLLAATSTLLNTVFLFRDANAPIALCNDFKSIIPSDSHSHTMDVGLLLISSPLTDYGTEAEKLVR